MKPHILTLAMVFLFVGLGLGTLALKPAGANVQQVPHPEVGRYRMTSYAPGGGIYMNDTATGECWMLNMSAKKWVRTAAPLGEK